MIIAISLNIFDWKGSEFLVFYGVAFLLVIGWSVSRRSKANEKFALSNPPEVSLTDPYEIAFLAGGAARCTQVVVVRLIKSGAVVWNKSKGFSQSTLVATGTAQTGFNDIELTTHKAILSYGKTGMPLTRLPQLVGTKLSGIESKLAKLGLRPTGSEAASRILFIFTPFLILILIGIIKLIVGISRGMPVGFLVIFLLFTVVAGAILAANKKKLTPAGESLLWMMRRFAAQGGNPQSAWPDPTLCGVALLGISGIAHDDSLAGLDTALRKEISQLGNNSSSSGCSASGCSSGCSSGCGSGCGGCGGD